MAERRWWISIADARQIQNTLRAEVVRSDTFDSLALVTGIDIGVNRALGHVRAAAATFALPELELVESSVAVTKLEFPYVPGYLSFRELPGALAAIGALRQRPDMLLVDGHGLAHPRRFGLASHLGVATGLPTVGVGKQRLVGHHQDPPERRGAWTPLLDTTRPAYPDEPEEQRGLASRPEETIGAVVRTRVGVKPIFVSIGHRVSLSTAVEIVMCCTGRYRLPETTRTADRLAARR